jgi:hypothetical protein
MVDNVGAAMTDATIAETLEVAEKFEAWVCR